MLSVGREGFDLLALLILKADKNINILLLKNGLELLHKLIKGIGVVDHLINFFSAALDLVFFIIDLVDVVF